MDLRTLEQTIESGIAGFREVGRALKRIRDRRMYLHPEPETGDVTEFRYESWQAYCRGRWHWTARHANRLIVACEAGRFLGPIGPENIPASRTVRNEAQARELLRVPPRLRRPLLQQLQGAGRPTARAIRQAGAQLERLTPAQTLATAAAAEQVALGTLSRLEREDAVRRIEKICGRLREVHPKLKEPAAADQALDGYLVAVRA
jgi:hypothetical protein